MKKNTVRILSALMTLCMLLGTFAMTVSAASVAGDTDATITYNRWEQLYYEDHIGKYLTTPNADKGNVNPLVTGNNTTDKKDGLSPLSNMYDDKITPDPATWATYETGSKNLTILGNHANENTSQNLFILDNNKKGYNSNTGMLTIIPKEKMAGLEEFTISYIVRTHKPNGGYAGLALFYDNAVTENGLEYFGGYDKFTFTGYTGNYLNSYAAFSTYGETVNFPVETMDTVHRNEADGGASNDSIYTKIHAVKGSFEYEGKTYTAKIESYSDDKLVATSYAQWADAPVFFYYQTTDARWSVQFTNVDLDGVVKVTGKATELIEAAAPAAIEGTSVRYDGTAGIRVLASLKLDDMINTADSYELGAILLEKQYYQGSLSHTTIEAIIKAGTEAYRTSTADKLVMAIDFEAPDIAADKEYMGVAYVKLTFDGKDYYYYTDAETVSVARTATKLVSKYNVIPEGEEYSWIGEMIEAVTPMAGQISTYKILSSNVLVPGNGGADPGWEYRMEALLNMLKEQQPDVAGFSEVRDSVTGQDQWAALSSDPWIVENYGFYYSPADPRMHVGDGHTGEEGLGMIYRKDKFELVASGTKYLSDTPDANTLSPEEAQMNKDAQEAAGSDAWITLYYPRKMTYLVLKDKVTGAQFAAVNTHLTHQSIDQSFSAVLRAKQAQILVNLCTGGELFDRNTPFVVFGDMNAKVNDPQYDVFIRDGHMVDVRYNADVAPLGTQGTYHIFGTGNTFIDHMFMSTGDFYARQYDILTKKYMSETLGEEIYYSDHYAIMGTLTVLPGWATDSKTPDAPVDPVDPVVPEKPEEPEEPEGPVIETYIGSTMPALLESAVKVDFNEAFVTEAQEYKAIKTDGTSWACGYITDASKAGAVTAVGCRRLDQDGTFHFYFDASKINSKLDTDVKNEDQKITVKFTVPEAGVYQFGMYIRLKEADPTASGRTAFYSMDGATPVEFNYTGCKVDTAGLKDATQGAYVLLDITFELGAGEHTLELTPGASDQMHFRHVYFAKIGELTPPELTTYIGADAPEALTGAAKVDFNEAINTEAQTVAQIKDNDWAFGYTLSGATPGPVVAVGVRKMAASDTNGVFHYYFDVGTSGFDNALGENKVAKADQMITVKVTVEKSGWYQLGMYIRNKDSNYTTNKRSTYLSIDGGEKVVVKYNECTASTGALKDDSNGSYVLYNLCFYLEAGEHTLTFTPGDNSQLHFRHIYLVNVG